MTTNNIKTLSASDKSGTLELKKITGELKDGMHSACAFLNTEGGWLIFGVTPNSHKIIGQEVTDKTQQEIAQALAGLEPAVDVRPEYVEVPEHPGNKVIAIHFVESIKRPHISYPYNPIIADVLFRTTFLENWGSGTGRIIDACRLQQVPEPQWNINGDFIVVTFPRPNVHQDVPQDVPQDMDLDRWIENQIAIRPKITTAELANLSGKTSKTIKRHIAKMPHIKYVGSGYSGHWEITNSDSL